MGSFFSRLAICFFLVVSSVQAADSSSAVVDTLIRKATEKRLWENQQWIYLGHYQGQLFGGKKSQADGRAFFLAEDGKTSPQAEMIATIRGFFRTPTAAELAPPKELTQKEIDERLKVSQGSEKDQAKKLELLPELPALHPVCRFPARLRFLERELGWGGEGLPKITCFRLEEFRKRLDAQSATLVFSSFYLNNPSSTFGHSFLRINSGLWSQYGNYRNELLDTGINYAAESAGVNSVAYPIMGMMGLLPGTFTAIPYYYKVREYNDFESRDLWGYDLNLTKDELAMLVDHIWEEGSTYYDYFYFDENCSYHMLTALDAAAPRYALAERLPFYVIPSNTIRVVYATPGLVSRVTYRPSILSQFRYRLARLDGREKASLDRIIEKKDPAQMDPTLSKEEQAAVLDAYSDQIELSYGKALLDPDSEALKLKQAALVRRASLGVRSPALDIPPPDRSAPHLAHGMRRISAGFAAEDGQKGAETFGYKFAMQELLDPGLGYARNMQIDFGQVRARYRNIQAQANAPWRKRIEMDEIGIFKLTGLTPYSKYYASKSIHAEFGWKKSIDRECEGDHRCLPLTLEYAPGFSIDPSGHENVTLFGLLGGRIEYSPGYLGVNFRMSAGPRLGALMYFSDDLRFEIGGETYARFWSKEKTIQYESDATLRWGFAKPWALDVSAKRARDWTEVASQLHFYY